MIRCLLPCGEPGGARVHVGALRTPRFFLYVQRRVRAEGQRGGGEVRNTHNSAGSAVFRSVP